MKRTERLQALVDDKPIDRPPVGAWIHFGGTYIDPATNAALHARFIREYDWDFAKVMHDYRYPVPGGVDLTEHDNLVAFADAEHDSRPFELQREALRRINFEFSGEMPIFDTLFNPLQTLVRTSGGPVVDVLRNDRALAAAVLERITDSLCAHVDKLADSGAVGLYLSINGAAGNEKGWGLTRDEFAEFIEPYDTRLLQHASHLITVAHLHGYQLDMPRLDNYEFDMLSWSNFYTEPTLEEVAKSGKRVFAGVDEIRIITQSRSQVKADVAKAREACEDRLVVAPGCTIHSDTSPDALRAMRRAVED